MVRLKDIFDQGLLGEAIGAGHIRVQQHPTEPLVIYNYTEAAVFARAWSPVTLECRGLIVHRHTTELLGRPFEKFFNHNEPESADLLRSDEPVTVTAKADGSLGILYPLPSRPGSFAVATRGSFTSEQAIHATEVWQARYADVWTPPAGMTALFEIVYPANRIVLDYRGLDDLILLGFVDIDTGRTFGPTDLEHGWPGPVAQVLPFPTLLDALAAEPTEGTEGYVVHFLDSDRRMKIKGSWYLTLHKAVTGLNARVVWEHLRDGHALDELLVPLPDELQTWAADVAADLHREIAARTRAVEDEFLRIISQLPPHWTRKDFALLARTSSQSAALFLRLDGKDYSPQLWRQIEPRADQRPNTVPVEEAA